MFSDCRRLVTASRLPTKHDLGQHSIDSSCKTRERTGCLKLKSAAKLWSSSDGLVVLGKSLGVSCDAAGLQGGRSSSDEDHELASLTQSESLSFSIGFSLVCVVRGGLSLVCCFLKR